MYVPEPALYTSVSVFLETSQIRCRCLLVWDMSIATWYVLFLETICPSWSQSIGIAEDIIYIRKLNLTFFRIFCTVILNSTLSFAMWNAQIDISVLSIFRWLLVPEWRGGYGGRGLWDACGGYCRCCYRCDIFLRKMPVTLPLTSNVRIDTG